MDTTTIIIICIPTIISIVTLLWSVISKKIGQVKLYKGILGRIGELATVALTSLADRRLTPEELQDIMACLKPILEEILLKVETSQLGDKGNKEPKKVRRVRGKR